MAAENPFPYTPTPGKLEEFFQKLQSIAVPPKIDQKYLGSVGFGSSHSRPFIPIMKKVGLAVSTFKALCKFGDFSGGGSSRAKIKKVSGSNGGDGGEDCSSGHGGQSNVTINVNIALSVDATSDPKVYDASFAAMAKHIKVLDGGSTNPA